MNNSYESMNVADFKFPTEFASRVSIVHLQPILGNLMLDLLQRLTEGLYADFT